MQKQFDIPIRIRSSANMSEHWSAAYRRKKDQASAVRMIVRNELNNIKLPVTVSLVRIAPRSLDDDNLIAALKHIRDTIADLIIPGKAPGRADSSEEITWQYGQQKQKNSYTLRITISQ